MIQWSKLNFNDSITILMCVFDILAIFTIFGVMGRIWKYSKLFLLFHSILISFEHSIWAIFVRSKRKKNHFRDLWLYLSFKLECFLVFIVTFFIHLRESPCVINCISKEGILLKTRGSLVIVFQDRVFFLRLEVL